MKKRNQKRLIGAKIIFDRIKNHLGIVNFLMLVYIFAISSPYPIWLILPGMLAIALALGYLDYRFILPMEFDRITEKNPFMVEMRKDIKEIKEKLK